MLHFCENPVKLRPTVSSLTHFYPPSPNVPVTPGPWWTSAFVVDPEPAPGGGGRSSRVVLFSDKIPLRSERSPGRDFLLGLRKLTIRAMSIFPGTAFRPLSYISWPCEVVGTGQKDFEPILNKNNNITKLFQYQTTMHCKYGSQTV